MSYNIGVVGAGAVGLTSAVNAQRAFPNAKVTVIADKFGKDVNSYGTCGNFEIQLDRNKPDYELRRECGITSWRFLEKMARSAPPDNAGVCQVHCTSLQEQPVDKPYAFLKELSHDYQELSKEALQKRGFGEYKYGCSFTGFAVQCPYYLEWLTNRIRENGGVIQTRKVLKLDELYGEFDLVINCCGLGAMQLVGDKRMHPVKGQCIYVRAPWVKQAYFSRGITYIMPQHDRVSIGITREEGRSDTVIDDKATQDIWARTLKLMPELKGAEVINSWAGVRPTRDCIRLELELVACGPGRVLPVVHNYGHGSHGIALSWGTAVKAVSLARTALRNQTSRL